MSPVTHALVGWAVACSVPLNRHERGLVTLAAIIPDLDGVGILVDFVSRHSGSPTDFRGTDHHTLGHNLSIGVICAVVVFMLSQRRWITTALVVVSFHLHLIGDVLGARGPDGDQWPIPCLFPFTDSIQWVWSGQWPLNAWPNFLITGGFLVFTLYIAWRDGISPLALVSATGNQKLVQALRARFGDPAGE